jgi:hypothetical protein
MKLPPPGIAIALLGIVAALIAIFPIPPTKKWLQALAFGVCIALVVVEMRAIVSDRKSADAQHLKDLAEQARAFSSLQILVIQSQQATLAALRVQGLPVTSIKKRALDLSNEILRFLVSREVQPGYGQGGYGQGAYGGATQVQGLVYELETIRMFKSSFGKRVVDIHDALQSEGLTDPELDAAYKSPVDSYSIRVIAERIGSLAERLTH